MPVLKKKTVRLPAYKFNAAKQKRRNIKRINQGKKPLIQPLKIALTLERNSALKKGLMVFFDGKKRIQLPMKLVLEGKEYADIFHMSLQGVYKTEKGRLITVRSEPSTELMLFELKNGKETLIRSPMRGLGDFDNFFSRNHDLSHMNIDNSLKGQGLGLKLASKAEREQRSRKKGRHIFMFENNSQFGPLFKKLGYRVEKNNEFFVAEKKGKHQPKDNLNKFHRIEAIDPKTGKTRIFTFLVKPKN